MEKYWQQSYICIYVDILLYVIDYVSQILQNISITFLMLRYSCISKNGQRSNLLKQLFGKIGKSDLFGISKFMHSACRINEKNCDFNSFLNNAI